MDSKNDLNGQRTAVEAGSAGIRIAHRAAGDGGAPVRVAWRRRRILCWRWHRQEQVLAGWRAEDSMTRLAA